MDFSNAFHPSEVEFIAQQEEITIVPKESLPAINLISMDIPAFKPPRLARVPMWLALDLRKRDKCTIQPPEWLNLGTLQEYLLEERNNPAFSFISFHYLEVAKLLLTYARQDIQDADKVETVLKDIRELRQTKARDGLDVLSGGSLGMDNLSLMEINELRPTFTQVFSLSSQLAKVADQNA